MDTDLEEMGLMPASTTFGNDILAGGSLVYSQDIPSTTHSDDLSSYGNRLAYVSIPVQIVQDAQNIISGYLLDNSQLPLGNRQVLVTQDSLLDLTEQAVSTDPSQDLITKELLSFVPTTTDICDNVDTVCSENTSEGNGKVTSHFLDALIEDIRSSSDVEPPDKMENLVKQEVGTKSKYGENTELLKRCHTGTSERTNIGPFICEPCDATFTSSKLYKKHKYSHLNEKPFKCKKCSESFNHESNLKLHIATHNTVNPFCPECKKSFSRIASLKAHIMIHECEESIFCFECGEEFNNELCLEEHMKDHAKEAEDRPREYTCLRCDIKFDKGTELRDHVKDHHKGKIIKRPKKRRRGAHVCEFCNKSFEKPSQLSRHKRIHTGEKPFKCDSCPKAFNQKGSLQIHMLKHNGLRPYQCQYCHANFSQKGNLQAHVKRFHVIASLDRVYQCKLCACGFRKLGSLNAHITRVHTSNCFDKNAVANAERKDDTSGSTDNSSPVKDSSDKENDGSGSKETQKLITVTNMLEDGSECKQTIQQRKVDNVKWHRCTYCTTEFKRPSDLVRHIRIHTHEKPYVCKLCFRAFAARSTLTGHMRTHTGVKNFVCEVCKKAFASGSSLKFHKRSHVKDKNISCKKCDMVFSTSNERTVHIMTEHSKKPTLEILQDPLDTNPTYISLDDVGITVPENVIITEDGAVVEVEAPNEIDLRRKEEEGYRPHKCNYCDAAFKRSSHLKNHIRTHTGEKPYPCSTCNSRFASSSALKIHMSIHSRTKKFSCGECGRNFSCQASLRRHFETHAPGHAYACPKCSKPYKTHAACAKHILTHSPPSDPQEKLKPVVLEKQKTKTLTVDENGMLSIVSDSMCGDEDKDSKMDEPEFHNDLGELIRSLQPGQQFTLTTDGFGGLSVTASQQIAGEAAPSLIIPQQTDENDAFGEFDERMNQQLFNSLTDDQKTPLFDHSLDGCVFLQNDNLEINGTVINANLATILPQPPLHRCDQCGMAFNSSAELLLHKETHMEKNSETHTCLTCTTVFSSQMNLQEHLKEGSCQLKTHEGGGINLATLLNDVAIVLRCNKCNLTFATDEDLNAHMALDIHSTEDACHICNKAFASVAELQEHLKTHLGKDTGCPTCNKSFPSEDDLARHILQHMKKSNRKENGHKKGNDVRSGKVSKKSSLRPRKNPARRLTEEETKALASMDPNPSSVSERVLLESILEKERVDQQLVEESKSKTEVHPNKCKYCPKTFRKPSDLVRHLRIHTGERPYQCPCCNKCFTVKSTASSHMKTHTKDRSYRCHLCFKMFATTGSLKVHMRLHTGSKPFSCPLCDARFRTSGHKKAHFLSHVKGATQSHKGKTNKALQKMSNPELSSNAEITPIDDFDLVPTTEGKEGESNGEDVQCVLSLGSGQLEQVNEVLSEKINSKTHILVRAIEGEGDSDIPTHYVVTFSDQVQTHAGDGFEEGRQSRPVDETSTAAELDPSQLLNFKYEASEFITTPGFKKAKQNNKENETQRSKFPCSVCKKGFAKENNLMKHMKKCHESKWFCNLCSQDFEEKNDLDVHMVVHALEQEWICTICEYNYPDEESFQSHKCLGTDGKPEIKNLPETPTLDLSSLFTSQYKGQVDVFGIPLGLKSLETPD